MSDDLVAFLNARLDEDEREIRKDPPVGMGYAVLPVRMHREVAAKRAILARHCRIVPCGVFDACAWCSDDVDAGAAWHQTWPCPDVLSVVAVYSDHPDYRPEWKP